MNSSELTLIVQDQRNIRARRDDGAEVSGEVEFDSLHDSLIRIFKGWLSLGKISQRRELEVFGTLLYRTIFGGEVGALFQQSVKETPSGGRLRVQLSFQAGAAELASLPWEYLYCPDTETRAGYFLSTSVDLVLSRYMPLESGRQLLRPAESPLRILIVVSQPTDLPPVVAAPVIEAIIKLAESYPIQIDTLDQPTIDSFLDTLEATKPHVLHFIGHGRFNRTDKQGAIALLKSDENTAEWCKDAIFADYFTHMRSTPRLVFLHLCEGGAIDLDANFAGLAPQLMRANIQAVVAMQYPITNKAAISFSRAFYRELAKGAPIDHAVQTGRWRITVDDPTAYDNRAFGTPVLYMHSRDGIILPVNELKDVSYTRKGHK
jgi:hypothetical protein